MVLTHQWAVPSYWFGNSTHDHTGRRKKNMKGPAKRVKVSSRVYKVTFKFHSYPPLSNHLHFSSEVFSCHFQVSKGKNWSCISTKELSLICLSAFFSQFSLGKKVSQIQLVQSLNLSQLKIVKNKKVERWKPNLNW